MSCTHMRPLTGGVLFAVAMAVMVARQTDAEPPTAAATDTGLEALAPAGTVTPTAAQLIEPADLARLLSDSSSRPEVLHVGFPILFRSGHITGSRHIGPASTPEGLQALKQVLRSIPRHQSIVLYCGCCPWADCPNVRPALQLAQELGRNDVKLLHLPRNFQRDWIDQGLPISSGDR
jgi:thiosulfate/3-mercaptopyruvate sulfurtransferase